jgi:osmotically inducible lipoprotein OsmB
MRTLRKLSSFAAAAGLSAMLAIPGAPANASVQGRDTLLGAGIGAIAGGLLGHGKIGPVVGGAAVGAAVGALAAPHHKHHATYYDRYGRRHSYVYYTGRRAYDRYGYYDPYGYYPRG